MYRRLSVVALLWPLAQIAFGVDRVAEVDKLIGQYKTTEKEFFEIPVAQDPTTAEKIRRYQDWPGWRFISRFVELAEAKPDDEAAFLCCDWIIERTGNVGNQEARIYDADQKAWQILAAHHTQRPGLPMMCLRAVQYYGTAQDQFLRGLLARNDLSRENMGFATLALAELLAHKVDLCEPRDEKVAESQDEVSKYLERHRSPEWGKDLVPANGPKFKAESSQLFREVLAHYADVPVTISARYFRDLRNLGEKAVKSLHALEHLTIGSESPNIAGKDLHGRPLDLLKYRGSVVVLSFWFTGCGPCMGMIPHEQRLVETYKGRPFALLGVCTDESVDEARKTAEEHKMDWPCWFDGGNGPIARDWNVLSWPTIYVLDKTGRIVTHQLGGEQLDKKIAELMDEKK